MHTARDNAEIVTEASRRIAAVTGAGYVTGAAT